MSNGDSLDGFVFPPFIPTAAARPAQPPAPPAPVAEEPRADLQAGAPRATMPWDVETPIVRQSADASPADVASEPAVNEADEEDLPWLERPEPREPVAEAPAAPAAEATPAQDEAFPEWLAWDDRDTDEARSEAASVAPLEGLEDFVPADDLGGVIAAPPAVEWAEAAPEPAQAEAADSSSWSLDAPEPAQAEAADSSSWSLDAPEAVEPPILAESAAELTFDSPEAAADAEPAFDITLDDGAFTFSAAETGEDTVDAAPAAPFVADEEAVIASEPDPFAAADEAETAVDGARVAASAGTTASGVFTDVAARLEDIARTLRERPDDLLSGSASDPLALLVAGYVMGYGARR